MAAVSSYEQSPARMLRPLGGIRGIGESAAALLANPSIQEIDEEITIKQWLDGSKPSVIEGLVAFMEANGLTGHISTHLAQTPEFIDSRSGTMRVKRTVRITIYPPRTE